MAHEKMLYLWSLLVEQVKENTPELKVKRDEVGDFRLTREDGRSFCNVVAFRSHVSVFVLPSAYLPDLVPRSLLVRKSGRVTFKFKDEDDPKIPLIGELIGRCYAARDLY
ncbi:MAG: hypothetical protein HOE69_00730 [Euryarchaeota archaeon]|jgi:hypothetical protein|nr:hypothetical protein [Euryarchaeota archaeon]